MIKYKKKAFGLNLLLRVNGSATYRAIIPAMMAVGVLFIMKLVWKAPPQSEMLHPYVAGVLISSIAFLVVFRMTQGYGRYCKSSTSNRKGTTKYIDFEILWDLNASTDSPTFVVFLFFSTIPILALCRGSYWSSI